MDVLTLLTKYIHIYIARKNNNVTEVKRFSRSFQFYGKLEVFGHCLVKYSSIINTRILSVPIRLQNSSSFLAMPLVGAPGEPLIELLNVASLYPIIVNSACRSSSLYFSEPACSLLTNSSRACCLVIYCRIERLLKADQSQDASLNLQFEWRLPPMRYA